ncbi:MAG: GntR family transcriptional regulator [Chloroflexi bacterium]|nr:GntR family transcriptional regulator [Chloroflexota bacterium]MCL5108601.1 GntR family transcriptional regulator [Chloroflexota bacterium]MDA8218609.1 GntR family transcriptional regulator [Dehalococcoidales bacterium]
MGVAALALEVPPVGAEFRSLGEQVYDSLLKLVVARRLPPGERLVLEELAARLHVSRTPVRQALSRLAGEGLVEPKGRNGFRVTAISTVDLEHLYELRLMCEQFAAEKGAALATEDELSRMASTLAEYDRLASSAEPTERLAYLRVDHEFHRRLVALAANPRLGELFERLNVHIQNLRAGPGPVSPAVSKEANAAEHRAILAALRARDGAMARQAVRYHVANSRERVLASLSLAEAAQDQ